MADRGPTGHTRTALLGNDTPRLSNACPNGISNFSKETRKHSRISTYPFTHRNHQDQRKIVSRSTTKYYDPAVTLSDDQIRELVRIGTTAPTSFHLQNWRFIAVRTPEAKARLSPIAWNQPPITEAAVTFIVCGQLADSSVIPERLAPLVEAGIMPAKMVPEWEIPARDLYREYPQRQRDEAVRTGTFGRRR